MVDRRRRLHAEAIESNEGWPVIPMASLFEQMSLSRRPAGEIARRSPGASAIANLWTAIERRLDALEGS
jgi:hypothetical protein